jgi:hypothetical protein
MGEKRLMEKDWNDRHNWSEEDNMINTWAQEDVNRLYSLLSSNNC